MVSSARLIDSTRVGTADVTHDPEFPVSYVLGIVLHCSVVAFLWYVWSF